MNQDLDYWMQEAIDLANLADAKVQTNPKVGAVVVDQQNQLLATGFHQRFGADHAEVQALKKLPTIAPTDCIFITLEPCCFEGKTKACTDFLIKKGIKKVVIGCKDPNPRVNGKGIQQLQQAGVTVIYGVLEQECQKINRIYNLHTTLKRPYVALKIAMSLDGKLALKEGLSQWITSKTARDKAQTLRSQYQAIAVGKNTLWQDNPQLNNRFQSTATQQNLTYQPIRVLFSNQAEILPDSKFLSLKHSRRIVLAGSQAKAKQAEMTANNIDLFCAPTPKTSIQWALSLLHQQKIGSLLVEGGHTLATEFIKAKLVDCLHLFISGKLFGENALNWVDDLSVLNIPNAPEFHLQDVQKIGEDVLIYAEPKPTHVYWNH